jgi:Tol biopolymer transport system component
MTPLPEPIVGAEDEPSQYAVSPEGSRLAYVAPDDDGTSQIFVADLDGSRVRQMTDDPIGADWPTWSPNGATIAYEGYGAGYDIGDVRNLFVLDVSSGESSQIADPVSLEGNGLQFTPDGSSLLYTAGTYQVPELRTVPVVGGESTILFGRGRGGMTDAANGSLSPDGSLVTMMGSAGSGGAFRFLANADSTELRQIVGRSSDPAGTWSPDGSRIVCSDGSGGIIVVDTVTGEVSSVAGGSAAIWLDDHTLLVEV